MPTDQPTPPVGNISETRLYDLVRYMRSELHTAGLITNEEYAWLATAATDGKPNQGSISAQRLATYDELRAEVARLTADREQIELELRQGWCLSHGCPQAALYGDDGEMQCNALTCRRDFKREPLSELREYVHNRRLATVREALDAARQETD